MKTLKAGRKRSVKPDSLRARKGEAECGATGLEGTAVYRQVPLPQRVRLDRLLFRHDARIERLEEVCEKLKLRERYGVTVSDVQRYRAALEQMARPVLASIAMAAIVQAMPRGVVRRLERDSQVIVWSRLTQHMTDTDSPPLTASEFARLASLLRPPKSGRRISQTENRRRRAAKVPTGAVESGLADAVRTLYGVNLSRDIKTEE